MQYIIVVAQDPVGIRPWAAPKREAVRLVQANVPVDVAKRWVPVRRAMSPDGLSRKIAAARN